MTHYLVAAHQTAASPELLQCVLEVATEDKRAIFTILVPATPVTHLLTWEEGETRAIAKQKAEEAGELFKERGLKVADTKVGDASHLLAIEDELAASPGRYNGIILSTLSPGISRWLWPDIRKQAERKFRMPVIHSVSHRPVKGGRP